eukprot:TRINITY_DN769_c0_g6_i1.p1 TRINITY_DN769_c0_g6~~TRINITY_DN769_c0_g6_i1.p1  ORF type:complete len:379 (+),score=66.70 TRINITY_DN769_c0_g6_i1:115-1251(+)
MTMEIGLAQDIMSYCLIQSQQKAQEELLRSRQAQRDSNLFAQVLQRGQVCHQIGLSVGIEVTCRLCCVSHAHGRTFRESMDLLSTSTFPELYICGGQARRQTLASMDRFVSSRGEWESLPPMPTARSFCCTAAAAGKIYVFGGEKDQRAAFAAAECFDPVEGEWERLPPMPTPRAGCAAAVVRGKIYVCGGLVMAHQVLDAVESFCPETNKWRRQPPMPTQRCGCAAAAIGGRLFVVGGQLADGTVLDKVECFDTSQGALSWSNLAPMPSARSGLSAVAAAGLIHVVGGLGSTGLTIPVVDRLDPNFNEWLQPIASSLNRAGCAVAATKSTVYVLGGFGSDRQDSDKTEALNVASGNVVELPSLPCPRRLCSGAVLIR